MNTIQEAELISYSGIIFSSGDGLIHEAVNGLKKREDYEKVIIK